jgi:hypothetical protein
MVDIRTKREEERDFIKPPVALIWLEGLDES